jgi:hypothetical protein
VSDTSCIQQSSFCDEPRQLHSITGHLKQYTAKQPSQQQQQLQEQICMAQYAAAAAAAAAALPHLCTL